MLVAARLGDAHGDDALALKTLESGLRRFGTAPPDELARAYLGRAELALRTGAPELARPSLAEAAAEGLSDEDRRELDDEFAHVTELVAEA